eukprot:CAMPEP_0181475676 /NCGR_PEP_ID=MMETSP1110-20121109/41310_1 /TAXON_ID=174948 /ORGANISM="Symbiodinium sp., Strain CCMP421" /LENGTH=621 /DNA_ID=CAMNT_0023600927 /DNA_START=76 /DNA_END=1941 /DNA_ORIENTATION=+
MIPGALARKSSLVRGLGAAQRLAQGIRGVKISSAEHANEGKQLDIEFEDQTAHRFPAACMKGFTPSDMASGCQSKAVSDSGKFTAETARLSEEGSKLMLRFRRFAQNAVSELYSATMLHAIAPCSQLSARPKAPSSSGSSFNRSGLNMARIPLARGMSTSRSILGQTRGMKVVAARPVNDGKQVDIEFADGSDFRFHAEWIKDSHPNLTGNDYYRKSAKTLFESDQYSVDTVKPSSDGSKIQVHFKNGDASNMVTEEYVSTWLHAFAPFVGSPLNEKAKPKLNGSTLPGTGSLLEDLYRNRKPWDSSLDMPRFDGQQMLQDESMQLEFLERMMDPGVAVITNVGKPRSLAHADCGEPLEDFVSQIIGRLNQHPVRATRFGVIHTQARGEQAGADYDQNNPLSMHTDHSVYHGTPGYLQFMYQARGSVRSKVCDGLAVAEYLRQHHPEDFNLLCGVTLTHSSRNSIYARNGAYRRDAHDAEGFSFELVHTHPILTLDKEGLLEKVVQSETKRGVSALPFDLYDRYMKAYKRWTLLVEEDRFKCNFDWPEHSMVVMNNWRVLHGRAEVPSGEERTMVFAYVMKTIYENRHRILKQRQAERRNPEVNDKWLTRLPNQVLTSLVQ